MSYKSCLVDLKYGARASAAGASAHQYCLLTKSPSLESTRFSLSLMRFLVSATLERA